jgi:transposase
MAVLHKELSRKGVTLRQLWLEHKLSNPDGLQYSQFCNRYRQWAQKQDVTLRQNHRAGEKLFLDYAGQTMPITDPKTGHIQEAVLFVSALGASSYTFVWASLKQDLPSWIDANVRAFKFYGGVTEILVPDNLKAGVTKPCRYEPDINPTYLDMAKHYGTVVIPARVRKPKDKAKVESAVQVAERWILAALRNHTFFSVHELNQAIAEKLEDLNNRRFQKMDTTRKILFETIDKPALKPLPSSPYEYAEWKTAGVNVDYHIAVDDHYYSVPYQLVKERVDVRLTSRVVEIFLKNRRVVLHKRSYEKWRYTTLPEHMPDSHRRYLEWTPSRIIAWAGKNGQHTENLVRHILESKPHPEQGFRSCLGIMRLAKEYSPERLNAACAWALNIKGYSYQSVRSILKTGIDQKVILVENSSPTPPIVHPNIRGNAYYMNESKEPDEKILTMTK